MNARMWGIIGGVALVLALLSPLVLGNSKKIEQLFEDAEMLYERSEYKNAIVQYKEALKESNKFGAKTAHIDKDFTPLVNLKIVRCYYELAEKTSDVRYYEDALTHIKKVVLDTQTVKTEAELTYLWAEIFYKTGKHDQAKTKFSWFIEKFPSSRWVPKALHTIAEINLKRGNRDEALRTFQKLVDKFSHSEFGPEAKRRIIELTLSTDNQNKPIPNPYPTPKTMYTTASDLKQEGKIHAAYQLYTNLITQYPQNEYVTDAYTRKAEIHLEAEDYVNARANYEEAIYSTPDAERKKELYEAYHRTYFVPVYANKRNQTEPTDKLFVDARLLRKEEQFLKASELYEQLTNRTLSAEDTIYALYWKGRCYYEVSLTDPTLFSKSVDVFKQLVTDHVDSSYDLKGYYYLALTYTAWAKVSEDPSKYQSVIDTVKTANTKYADSNEPRYKGLLSLMQELGETAVQKLKPPPKPQPDPDPDPKPIPEPEHVKFFKQAQKDMEHGDLKTAAEKAKQARSLNPNYMPAEKLLSEVKERHYGRGWTFFDVGNFEKAIAEFREAISIDPNYKEAHCHLGAIYIEQKKYTDAIETLRKAVNIDKEFKEAHFNLALAHLELGEFEAATYAANAALKIDPNYEPAHILIEFIVD